MLCVVITGPTFKEAKSQTIKAQAVANLLEFRIDRFRFQDPEQIKNLMNATLLPVIFKLGKTWDPKLIALKPEYIDLDHDADIPSKSHVKMISSFHDIINTPDDLESIYIKMQQKPAHLYKICTMAQSTTDALRMLRLVKKHHNLIGLCMGEAGQPTRVLGSIFGNPWTYTVLNESGMCAPGQLTAATLLNYKHLNQQTKIYGLIGDPVDKSPSHITHNEVMRRLGLNAVYVKFMVTPRDLKPFLEMSQELGFQGFSVTMPLKEKILGYAKPCDPIGAVNTIRFTDGGVDCCNTDGSGALDCLSVENKKILLLGAGGAARAFAFEAKKRGADLYIANRTKEKAQKLGNGFGLDEVDKIHYDILVNATPVGMPIPSKYLLPGKVVLDMTIKPKETPLIREAKKKKCMVIYGIQMFINQAAKQFSYWFDVEENEVKAILSDVYARL